MVKSALFFHILFAMLWLGSMFSVLFFFNKPIETVKGDLKNVLSMKVYKRLAYGGWMSAIILALSGSFLIKNYRPDLYASPLFHIKLFLFALMVAGLFYIQFFLLRKSALFPVKIFTGLSLLFGTLITLIATYIK